MTLRRNYLIVPGFNGGNPLVLLDFEFTPMLRSAGGGRTGRLADWSGRFDVESVALAHELSDHLDHTFEEGQSAVSEIVEETADATYRYEGVALRHRGGVRFTFDAFSRAPIPAANR